VLRWMSTIRKKMDDMRLTEPVKAQMIKKLKEEEAKFSKAARKKVKIEDFTTMSIIGRGAFGEVFATEVCHVSILFISCSNVAHICICMFHCACICCCVCFCMLP
jgi:hypothetical protein